MKKSKKSELSIVIPCYNEAKNIPLVLKKFSKAIGKKRNIELILVNNNSKDHTQRVLREELKKYNFARSIFQPIPGYGAAIKKGLNSCKGEFIGWTHADLQTPPADAVKAIGIIKSANNPKKTFVKGKRYGRPITDKIVNSIGMSIFETLVLRTPMYDINAQPNIFHKSFLKLMKNPPTDFAFDLYVYYIAKKNKYTIKRFPVYFGKRIFGESAWNTSWKARFKFVKRTINFTFKLKKML